MFLDPTKKNTDDTDSYHDVLGQLLFELIELRKAIVTKADERLQQHRKDVPNKGCSLSLRNLAHYLAMRQFDLRPLQDRLAEAGLSSLGRAEAAVVPSFDALIDILKRATDKNYQRDLNAGAWLFSHEQGKLLLTKHTRELLGGLRDSQKTHVMVTLDTTAAWNYPLVTALLQKGMSCARINCAHDKPEIWSDMINTIRHASTDTGLPCRILMDLAGHKIRTGGIALEQPIHHIKVKKDRTGKIVASGYLVLSTDLENSAIETDLFKIQIPKELHKKLAPGALLEFIDSQKKTRQLKIEKALSSLDWLVSCDKPAYLVSGCRVRFIKPEYYESNKKESFYPLGKFAGESLDIRVFKDESLLLTSDEILGRPAEYSDSGVLIRPAHIGCTLASAVKQLKIGDPVWIDDGKLGAVVETITDQGVLLRITYAKPSGVRIQNDKGINFPETDLKLPPLSRKDLKDLDFVCANADMVGFSFVETLSDMNRLQNELKKRNTPQLPIIAKIETSRAVKNLPEILLGTMGKHPIGVMIARGDLAVELGNARLAEIQEELLWLCEAAHIPVIWATQVLESIAKKSARSRPEFTDAAMSVRAECVMLNKGPYILDAIDALINVMNRMDEHQYKKFSRLRKLHW